MQRLRVILGLFWVPKIGPKAHWITVEGIYLQSVILNTPYTVLMDFKTELWQTHRSKTYQITTRFCRVYLMDPLQLLLLHIAFL